MKIVVVGDVLLDIDIAGAAERLSPDAPVPVIDVETKVARAGGAGLVATLLARDGYQVELVTALADDAAGAQLRGALTGISIISGDTGAPTPVKTRLRAHGHPIARIDENCGAPPAPQVTDQMIQTLAHADAVVVADYGRGLTGDTRIRETLAYLADRVTIVWDPHPRGARPVPGVTVITPNLSEATSAIAAAGGEKVVADDVRSVTRGATTLREQYGSSALVVTWGSRGALLVAEHSAPLVVAAPTIVADDTCGAGDRFAASLAAQLARGSQLPDALREAVTASAEFLSAGGVASLAAPANKKWLGGQAATALEIARAARAAGGTVVATGGCFDLLHAGHARTLSAARALGDCLIVCVNSDTSVTSLKGPDRPIMAENDRVSLLLALECVDAVVVFDEDTPENVLSQLTPDIWVKGGDYLIDDLPEAKLVSSWGGQTVTVPFYPGRSTTKLAGALARVG
jgi:D-beta-D-heptose 7-phosphate kinase/D-beta-D-heptose 1-phosphate adenosyltransferase